MDINVDMGESFGNWSSGEDAALMPLISSANIACGFHAGDPRTMVSTARLAIHHGVAVGAHPGLPDLMGFGRRRMDIGPEDGAAYFVAQVGAMDAAVRVSGGTLHHVKPHGAFVGLLREDAALGEAVAEALHAGWPEIVLYFPAPTENAALGRAAAARGIKVVGEIYPDLSYKPDGDVIIERQKRRTDIQFAVSQVRSFMDGGVVRTTDGSTIELSAESICIHGDGPNAVEVAAAIRTELLSRGVEVKVPIH